MRCYMYCAHWTILYGFQRHLTEPRRAGNLLETRSWSKLPWTLCSAHCICFWDTSCETSKSLLTSDDPLIDIGPRLRCKQHVMDWHTSGLLHQGTQMLRAKKLSAQMQTKSRWDFSSILKQWQRSNNDNIWGMETFGAYMWITSSGHTNAPGEENISPDAEYVSMRFFPRTS